MKTLGTQSVPSQPAHATHTYVLINDVMDQGAVYKEWHLPEILGSFDWASLIKVEIYRDMKVLHFIFVSF